MQISTPSGDIHPRNPWIAALLSLALPGLGQLYNGDLNKALWLFLGFVLIGCFPGVTIAALYVPAVLMLPLLLISVGLTLGLWGVAIIDAWRGAARRQVYTRREWQVSGLYAVLLLAGNAFILMLVAASCGNGWFKLSISRRPPWSPVFCAVTGCLPTRGTIARVAKREWLQATSEFSSIRTIARNTISSGWSACRATTCQSRHITLLSTAVVFRVPKSSKATISWSLSRRDRTVGVCDGRRPARATTSILQSHPARYSCSAIIAT